ncbi:hypothetical protein HAX54_014566 [Datura stramonium]|uniref:Uncharacterized protein n=1 Tax=Datura stramonium TaxID=4076 RepID=A0ABS8TPU8_DATST|nr:hypothetical protein [Datura stramonium]
MIPREERRTETNFIDLTLMELFDTWIQINLPNLMIQHVSRIYNQDKKGHSLAYRFWPGDIFEHLGLLIKVCNFKTTKDMIGKVNQATVLASLSGTSGWHNGSKNSWLVGIAGPNGWTPT